LIDLNEFSTEIKDAQADDEFCQQLDNWLNNPGDIPFSKAGYFKLFSKIDDLWKYKEKAIVLPNQEYQLYFLERYHGREDLGHWGYKKTLDNIQQKVYWKNMVDDVREFVRSCDRCQRNQAKLFVDGLLKTLEIPDNRGESIAIDFATMPKEKDGNNYLMCITDRLSKIIEAIATKSTITAKETAILLYENWYLKGFGLPKSIVSDRDVKFTSQVWTEFCKLVGIEQKMSTSRHQQTNGQSESSIKILETAL